jgi:hypothetical protein
MIFEDIQIYSIHLTIKMDGGIIFRMIRGLTVMVFLLEGMVGWFKWNLRALLQKCVAEGGISWLEQ